MQNPFESGQIKNYLLFYAGVVVIMVLFFIASSLFLKQEEIEQKQFATKKREKTIQHITQKEENTTMKRKFKLLERVY